MVWLCIQLKITECVVSIWIQVRSEVWTETAEAALASGQMVFGCSVFFRHAAQHKGRLYGPVILQQTHWSNPKRSQGPNCRHDSPPPPSSPSLCCTYISLSYLSLPHPLLHRECIWRSMLCFCVWAEDRFVWQKDNSQFRIHYKFRKTNTKSGKHFSFSFSPLKDFLSALNLSLIVECSSQWQVWLCWPLGLLESTRL